MLDNSVLISSREANEQRNDEMDDLVVDTVCDALCVHDEDDNDE